MVHYLCFPLSKGQGKAYELELEVYKPQARLQICWAVWTCRLFIYSMSDCGHPSSSQSVLLPRLEPYDWLDLPWML